MSIGHERDYERRFENDRTIESLEGTSIEIVDGFTPSETPAYAVFDFDGTLSLIREGWPDVMLPLMIEALQETGTDETAEQLAVLCRDFIDELTGKQTIYQMMRLAEEITKRGGSPQDPLIYKHDYHDRLMQRIHQRRESLRSGEASADTMLVPGSLTALEELRDRNVQLYLASGTDERYVREEVELLRLTEYFGEHVYGAQDDFRSFSKQMVIERILSENNVEGARLIGFGDGYVEIDNIKSAGGTAIAVASDESRRNGQPDLWKRERLLGVGADVVIPDFAEFPTVCRFLWQEMVE